MNRNKRYPGVSMDGFLGQARLSHECFSIEEMIGEADKTINIYGRSQIYQRGKEIYESGGVKSCNCTYSRIRGSFQDNAYISDVRFNSIVKGSTGDNYDCEIHLIREESCLYYKCSCPYYDKDPNYKQICKHVAAAIIWIKNKYVFDENNYITDYQEEPYVNKTIKIADSSVNGLFVNTFEEFEKRIGGDAIAKLRLFEKANRFLEKGLASKEDSKSGWFDIYSREQFKNSGKDYDAFMNQYLFGTDYMISRGRHSDADFIDYDMRQYSSPSLFSSFDKRVQNIEHSIAENPFQVASFAEFQRVIDTYTRSTKFKVGSNVFEGKYIYIPAYFEVLVIEAKVMPLDFYNRFKLGNKTFKDGIVYEVNNRQYFVLVNYLGLYNNTVGEDMYG